MKISLAWVMAAAIAFSTSAASAGPWRCVPQSCTPGPVCAPVPCAPKFTTVQKTIMVPEVTWENRVINVTDCRPEIRQRTVMVPKMIPEHRQVERFFTVMKPVYSTQTVHYTVPKAITSYHPETYCVQVPYTETRQLTRTAYRQVPYQVTSYVCEDQGQWEERQVVVCGKPCGGRHARGCATCNDCATTCTQQVWVPNIVKKPVVNTCYRTECYEEPYTTTVTLYRSETRTRNVRTTNYVPDPRTRQIRCTNYVPEVKSKMVTETSFRCEMVSQVQNYTEYVPYTTQKTISVPVCRMVPKVITCDVPCL